MTEISALLQHAISIEPLLRTMLRRHLGTSDVDDALQHIYQKLLVLRSDLTIRKPTGFLLTMARHTVQDIYRRRDLLNRPEPVTPMDFEDSPEETIYREQVAACILQHLKPEEQQLVQMQSHGMSLNEIASHVHLNPRTVKRRLRLLHVRLAGLLRGGIDKGPLALTEPSGSLYEATSELALSERKIITDVTPKLFIANAALAERLKRHPEGVHDLTPRQFEELIGELLTGMGTGHVEITPYTRDGGLDLLAYVDLRIGRLLCLIEVKKYRRDRPVGIELVRNLYAVVCLKDASHGTLVTTSTFSNEAHKLASERQHRLSLRDYNHVSQWIRNYRISRP